MLEQVNNTLGRIEILGDTSSWDFGFMESLRDQLQQGRTLSDKQQSYFQQILGRWSDEAIKSRDDFTNNWNEEQEAKFAIALRYYQKTGYYSNIVHKYMLHTGEIGGIPTEKEYNKLVENKYAAGVIRNVQAESKFPVGGTAVFRTGSRTHKGKACVILKYGDTEHVTSHAKGAKPIQVLPIGSSEPCWTEERWLKKAKKRK
jgi:hypothetical protein